ncbi:MAG: PhoH family protein [Acidobacteriota bacterium]|nr:PhoH family protein [Acidobacteriota bacterium]MDH3786251.1 PhoH family protein [Acidobacteriota bacterium]
MKTINLDARVVETIAGNHEETLRLLEDRFAVTITARGSDVLVSARNESGAGDVEVVASFLEQLQGLQAEGVELRRGDLRTAVELLARDSGATLRDHFVTSRIQTSTKRAIVPKSENQRIYINEIQKNDLVFGIGPAGTGKTYLAVANAVSMLNERRVKRIILARPAVEAGENLGFLPGDLTAKVDPYLRPLYDALYDMLEPARAERFLEDGTIEVAPLAFMRGRTLDHSFMILDEAQNTTSEQMKMFLTRIGVNTKAVVTGDVTQVDLPRNKISGLIEAREIVSGVPGISFVEFDEIDVVRHPLVKRIIRAYQERLDSDEQRDV